MNYKACKPFYGLVKQKRTNQERWGIKRGWKGCMIKSHNIP